MIYYYCVLSKCKIIILLSTVKKFLITSESFIECGTAIARHTCIQGYVKSTDVSVIFHMHELHFLSLYYKMLIFDE